MSLDLYREDVEKHSSGSPCYIADMTFYVRRIGTKQAQTQIAEIKEKLYGLFPKPHFLIDNVEIEYNSKIISNSKKIKFCYCLFKK